MLKYKIILLGLIFLSPLVNSATYSWVDEDGITHYSQTMPPSGDYSIVDPKHNYPSEQPQDNTSTPATTPTSDRNDATTATAPAAAGTQKAEKEQCQRVEADLEKLKSTARVSIETDAEVKVLTEEEKQSMINERIDWLKRYCE